MMRKQEYKHYLKADALSCGLTIKEARYLRAKGLIVPNTWRFQILLRKSELSLRRNSPFDKVLRPIRNVIRDRYGRKLGFEIPPLVFGPGLCLCHGGSVVINSNVRFGSNARVHAGVNIGAFGKIDEEQRAKTPCFGDNVYVGPGAKVFGPICIGDNVAIGVGAVVYRSVPSNCTVVGTSMRVMEGKGSAGMLKCGDQTKCTPEFAVEKSISSSGARG